MLKYSDLIRSRATQIAEIRRTGSQPLANKLLADLFLLAEGLDTGAAAQTVADTLSDALAVTAPADAPLCDTSTFPYLATFQGQAWIADNAHAVDDAHHRFPVSRAEAAAACAADDDDEDALNKAYEFDALSGAACAPPEARDWSGPFDIRLTRRLYRISGAGVTRYADDEAGVRAVMIALMRADAKARGLELDRSVLADIATFGGLEHVGAPPQEFASHTLRLTVVAQPEDLDDPLPN